MAERALKNAKLLQERSPSGQLSKIKPLREKTPTRVRERALAATSAEAFQQLNRMLEETYPLVHQKLKREVINGYSLLYTWGGSRLDLEPVMLMAHQDVVSADPTAWTHPPFEGRIVDGFVWGDDNAYNNCTMVISDKASAVQKALGLVSDYTGASKTNYACL